MSTVNVNLHTGRQTVTVNGGDTIEATIFTGANGDQPSKVSITSPNATQNTCSMSMDGAVLAGSELGPSVTLMETWNAKNPATDTIKQPIGKNVKLLWTVNVDPSAADGSGYIVDLTIGRG